MTALFGFRQRADEFAARADGLVEGSADPTAASSAGPGALGQQDLMLALVTRLRHQPQLASDPRPEFAASLRDALMAEAATVLPVQAAAPARRPLRAARPRRLAAAATAAVLVSGSAGMAAAAETSLPGEALYPVKRGMETVDVRLSRTAAGRGHDLLSQAATRLSEVEGLLALDRATAATYVPPTLATFTWQAEEGAEQLLIAYGETKDASTIAEVRSFAADSAQTLTSIVASSPTTANVQEELHAAASSVGQVDEAAADACEQCSPLGPVDVDAVLLASAAAEADPDGFTGAPALADGGVLEVLGGTGSTDPLASLAVDQAPADPVHAPPLGEAAGGGAVAPPAAQAPPSGGTEANGEASPPSSAQSPPEGSSPSGQPSETPTTPDAEQPPETPSPSTDATEAPSGSGTPEPGPSSQAPPEVVETDPTTAPTGDSSTPADDSTLPADTDAGSTGDRSGALVEATAPAVPVGQPTRSFVRDRNGRATPPGRSGD
jgi:hypothetical protein